MLNFKAINLSSQLNESIIHLEGIRWIENQVDEELDGIIVKLNKNNFKEIESFIKKSIPIFILNLHDLSFENAQRLFKLSNEAETIIQVNSPLRFENQAKDIINSLGSFKLISFRKSLKDKSSDYFKELLFNEIDSFISIIKARTRKIQTFVIPEDKNPIETIDCRIDLDNGIILKLLFSSNFPLEINQIELFGEKLFKVISYETHSREKENFNIQVEEFKNNILQKKEPKASIEDGLTSIRILTEIFTKLAQ
jgi:hypothetical protein